MKKVVITDSTFGTFDVEDEILCPLGCTLEGRTTAPADLASLVSGADYVITQFAPLTAAVIEAMQKARAIVRYVIGVDNVDLEAAARKNISVCNVPDYCIDEVADHTLALILAITRQIQTIGNQVRRGDWKIVLPMD